MPNTTITLNADGERYTYDANADNPERRWVLRQYFTMYGGRCESYRDVALPATVTNRSEANAFVAALATVVGA